MAHPVAAEGERLARSASSPHYPARRRTLRFAFDRSLQQIAQFPYSGQRCNVRFADLKDISDAYRVLIIQDLFLIYFLDEAAQMIVLIHVQTTTMDAPRPEMLIQ
ncbi:MAG: hypothetical protein ACR2JW_02265 [Thermomicrobiales bacterium]